MLEAAMAENPQAEIWVKVHRMSWKERKQVISLICAPRNETFDCRECQPAVAVATRFPGFVVTSQYGFEALLAGKPVTCLASPGMQAGA